MELLDWINDQLTILAEAFGEGLTEQRQEIYCGGLADIGQERLDVAFRRARYELKWFPKLAELRELAGILPGASDGRRGPEEAWARMPKGERMEDDSVVWCEEERLAYFACRDLLIGGDQVGARMAFKERYERELAEARFQGRPVRWSLSAGFDIEHRLTTLASAVQETRMTVKSAMKYVPGDRQSDFARMLPAGLIGALLTGEVEKPLDIPGLARVLARMEMDGALPPELKTPARPTRRPTADRSPDEVRALRQKAREQIELLKRSRNGSRKHC